MKTFEPQIAEVKKYVGKQIGNFKTTIYSRDQFFGSSAFNDFILNLQLQITKADISFNAAKLGRIGIRTKYFQRVYVFFPISFDFSQYCKHKHIIVNTRL